MQVKLVRINDETPYVKTFRFEDLDKKKFSLIKMNLKENVFTKIDSTVIV